MDGKDFQKYIPVLKQDPFIIFPPPKGANQTILWHSKKFIYVDDSPTHVTIQDVETQKHSDVPLALVEFANKGILRVAREIWAFNGSFV